MLALKLISPVLGFRFRPVVDEKAPPVAPVMVGEGLVPVLQNEVPLYAKAALGTCFGAGVTELLAGLGQPPTVCVAVSAVVDVTVRGLPLPPSLQVSVPVKLLAVTVALPQLFTTASVGAPGTALITKSAPLIEPDILGLVLITRKR